MTKRPTPLASNLSGRKPRAMLRKYQTADLEELLNVWANASALAHPFLSQAFLALERYNIPNLYMPKAETWV